MKRFWNRSTAQQQGDHYMILLDRSPVKLPSGTPLAVTCARLAEAIAQEWGAAGALFSPDDLPLTQLVCTAEERIAPQRTEIISSLAMYGLNDLLCYRADSPASLVARQHAQWDPWLHWLEAAHGIGLITTNGLMPVTQLPWTADKLTDLLTSRTNYELAALGVLIPTLGSFVLGLATAEGLLTPNAACAAAMLDELWQAEQWGEDAEDEARRQTLLLDVKNTVHFLKLVMR